jgi:hypothetical protein
MKLNVQSLILLALMAGLIIVSGCKSTERKPAAFSPKMYSGSAAPDWIYDPPYYHYKNGRYTFVKGHYRRVWFRKSYMRRKLKGYGSPAETAAR